MKRKNNLDERQEQELLRIEHNGMWFAFWALLAAIMLQEFMGAPASQYAGEWVVFMALCLYSAIACVRHGIWDRHFKPNLKTNVWFSAAAGAVILAFVTAMVLRNTDGEFVGIAVALGAVAGAVTFALCLVVLVIAARATQKRQHTLEQMDEDETDCIE